MDMIEGGSSESLGAPGNDTSTRSGEFFLSLDPPGAFMVSWHTSARVRESTGPLGTNLPADSGMAKPQRLKPGDGWFAYNLGDQLSTDHRPDYLRRCPRPSSPLPASTASPGLFGVGLRPRQPSTGTLQPVPGSRPVSAQPPSNRPWPNPVPI